MFLVTLQFYSNELCLTIFWALKLQRCATSCPLQELVGLGILFGLTMTKLGETLPLGTLVSCRWPSNGWFTLDSLTPISEVYLNDSGIVIEISNRVPLTVRVLTQHGAVWVNENRWKIV